MDIQLFNNPQFGNIRTAGTPDNPEFCLSDVCNALSLDTANVRRRLTDGVCTIHPTVDALGRTQPNTYINEDGLYDVILDSRKPEAKAFRKWITSEVIPCIRKNGVYATNDFIEQSLADPEYAIQLLRKIQEERQLRLALAKENEEKQALLEEQKPKVVFADAIVGGKTNILIRDLAKLIQQNGYEIGEKRLYVWLRENKYLTISNMPMQRYVEMGLFFVDEGAHSESGVMKCHFTTKVTPKGQQYFVNKFLGGN